MIKIINLYKSFNGQEVLRGINLEIEDGKTTVILGPSGCGKSVLIKHILKLLVPDSGSIIINGEDITKLDARGMNNILRKLGVLFQGGALFDSMTIEENVAFPLYEHKKLAKSEISEKVKESLFLVGLSGTEKKYPSELSGGMRKRAAMARAIVTEPEILIFDEPTTGLDPITSDQIDNLIIEFNRRFNITNIVISHDIPGTFKIAHKIAMMYSGKIIEEGTPEEFRRSRNPVVRQFLERRA
jgi:phospholipid/cholesterol/gamma-HCH transport system ATP-binding protein